MSPTYKRLLVAVDAGLLLYWAAVLLNLIPENLRFKDYSNQVIQAWNWSFPHNPQKEPTLPKKS